MGYQMQNPLPHHFKLESDTLKLEPSPIESPLCSPAQTLQEPLPSISAWYDDNTNTRRSSTSSLASSWTLLNELQSPVDPVGDLARYERASRRLSQLEGQMQPLAAVSPYPSPRSTPGIEDHAIQKSKAKAKRAVRGVAKSADKELTQQEKSRMEAKAIREQEARFEQSLSYARAWQECKLTNPNFIIEGVTKDGRRGLRQLKRNNIDDRIDNPNEINKDQLMDLLTLCHRQLREMLLRVINELRSDSRFAMATALERELREIGTHL